MSIQAFIASAANTLAPALAVLESKGYTVSRETDGERLYWAQGEHCRLCAEDPLLLLGLAAIFENRGAEWQPNEHEVAALMKLESNDV